MMHDAQRTVFAPGEAHVSRNSRDAVAAIRQYQSFLTMFAQDQVRLKRKLKDQSYPAELFALRPAGARLSPLVLLGGMGPLAGASGFELACQQFRNTREIVLFQPCAIPDRTSALTEFPEVRDCSSPEYASIVNPLAAAIRQALLCITFECEPVDLIVLCNTSHFFLPAALRRLRESEPDLSARIRFNSLIDATMKKIHQGRHTRIMALYTLGTRLSRIYSARFEQERLLYLEASGDIERSLMHSIYDGVKAFDDAAILQTGTCLFNQLLAMQDDFDCVVAGCTEIPFVVKKLRARGSPEIKRFLRRIEIIDPVAAALEFT